MNSAERRDNLAPGIALAYLGSRLPRQNACAKLPTMQQKLARLLLTGLICLTLVAFACGGGEKNPLGVESEVVTAADHPASLAFAPDGRLFYGEQLTGNIRIVG